MRLVAFICICMLFEPILAQTTINFENVAKQIATIKQKAKMLSIDKLGNIYVVTTTNQLYKYSSNGTLLSTLNFNYSGNITSLDVTNPLEIYVFYQELNTIVFLDNNLAFRGKIDLGNSGIHQAFAIARSYENGIWVFDATDLMLKKLDKEGNITQTSGNIRQYINANFKPQCIIDDGLNVFISDSGSFILHFDVFANYKKNIPAKNSMLIGSGKNTIHVLQQNSLAFYKLKPFGLLLNYIFNNLYNTAAMSGAVVAIANNNEVVIYKLETQPVAE
ncbi:MAG: hypothetical protein ACK4K9_07510 [Bacteroidia bacterium]